MKRETYYICPLVDFTFKRIFGTENNKKLLIAFLNSAISEDTGIIEDIQYMTQEQVGENESEKNVIFDIYCTNQKGDRFIIEMQRSLQHFFANRTISYVCRAIISSLRKGDKSYRIPTVYSINLLDFQPDMFPEKDEYMWKVMLKDGKNRVFSKKIMLYFFKLSNFAAQTLEKRERFSNEIEKWFYYLKNIQNMDEQDYRNEQDPIFKQLLEECTYKKLNDMEQEEYKKDLLEYEGIKDAIEYAREQGEEKGREEGLVKGLEEGLEKGREEGLAEGIEKGIEQGALQTARKLLSLGVDIPTIIAATSLSEEEIKGSER